MTTMMDMPRLLQRDLDATAADPARLARVKATHMEGLRKLATAVNVAIGGGATMEEIQAIILACSESPDVNSRLAVAARARCHDGNPKF